MSKEQELYDKFVDTLSARLDGNPTPKDLDVIRGFLKDNNIQASNNHRGLRELNGKVTSLPFDNEEELPLKRIK